MVRHEALVGWILHCLETPSILQRQGALFPVLHVVCIGGGAVGVLCVTTAAGVRMLTRFGPLLLSEACTAWPVLQGRAPSYKHHGGPVFCVCTWSQKVLADAQALIKKYS